METGNEIEWARHYLREEAGPRLADARTAERLARRELVDALKGTDLGRAFASAHATRLRVAAEIEAANQARELTGEKTARLPDTDVLPRVGGDYGHEPLTVPLARAVQELAEEQLAADAPRSVDELSREEIDEAASKNAEAHAEAEADPLKRLHFNGAIVETYQVAHPSGITLTAHRNTKTGNVVYTQNGTVVTPGEVARKHAEAKRERRRAQEQAAQAVERKALESKRGATRWDA